MKIEKIIEPNTEIQNLQESLLTELTELLPDSHIELVGAMAVPMVGRPEIDIMILSEVIEEDINKIIETGYSQGPTENGISYFKKMHGGVEIGVQIMSLDNKMANVHRNIIIKLQGDDILRKNYEDFKKTLVGLSPEEYKKRKSAWIEENLL